MKILDRTHASNFTYNDLDEGLRKGLMRPPVERADILGNALPERISA